MNYIEKYVIVFYVLIYILICIKQPPQTSGIQSEDESKISRYFMLAFTSTDDLKKTIHSENLFVKNRKRTMSWFQQRNKM